MPQPCFLPLLALCDNLTAQGVTHDSTVFAAFAGSCVCCQGIPPAALSKVSSQSLRDFITLCINPNPAGRPSALELLKHEFFDSLKLGKLLPGLVHQQAAASQPF
jgi:serine/threonine protein kinase